MVAPDMLALGGARVAAAAVRRSELSGYAGPTESLIDATAGAVAEIDR